MELRDAWQVITDYVGNLESLAETVEAYRDSEEVIDESGLSVSELDQRTDEAGGHELVQEAWQSIYDAIKPMMGPIKKVES